MGEIEAVRTHSEGRSECVESIAGMWSETGSVSGSDRLRADQKKHGVTLDRRDKERRDVQA